MAKRLTGEQITRHIEWLSDVLHQSCRERAAVGCPYSDNLARAEAYDSLLTAIRGEPEHVAKAKPKRPDHKFLRGVLAFKDAAQAMSAGTAETRSGSGRQPASAVANGDAPDTGRPIPNNQEQEPE